MSRGRRPLRFWLLVGYAVALVASTVVRLIRRDDHKPEGDERSVVVALAGGAPTRIAYRERMPAAGDAVPVVLLHGSPGDNGEVSGLAQSLGDGRRAIAPDLPGFGGSTWRIPDYSIVAHARYLAAMLDSLRIPKAHVVGFSMGGGVALELAAQRPERVASITLLSAIGAQEYELLGEYHLNHAIHGLQLGGLWLVENALPHFGALDGGMLTTEYARNFYDTDQRPLRTILAAFSGPALVIQGDKDPLVDPAVAVESSRLLPQSKLVMLTDPRANHFMAFQRPDSLARIMEGFFYDADLGVAPLRATAAPDRIARAAARFDPTSIPAPVGVALGLLLLLLAAATFVSEDLACITAGLLVARGSLGFVSATIACFVGIVLGDLWLYGVGRWLGRPALARIPLRWFVSEKAVDRSAVWFRQRGIWIVFLTRFLPGTRLPTYLMAGVVRAGAVRFLGAFFVAAIVWTPLLVGASTLFGDEVLARFIAYERFALPGIVAVAVALLLLFKLIVPLCSWRGRRLLLSRWHRLTRWEFWPRWAFYPPIVLYVVWLTLKHRRLTMLTAVNPAIPGGGFVGESKAQILGGLAHAPSLVATWRLIPVGPIEDRVAALENFLAAESLTFPVVLKPDVGERGGGVAVIRSLADARDYLTRAGEPIIAQEFVPGVEFGVFYYRLPGDSNGHIFAITDKRFPAVVGDGQATLEHLILADDRAVSMAPFFLTRHADRLATIPAAGEAVPLVELGTHCRGSAFFDGEWVRSAELEAAIDQLSKGYQGFWFGRYDIRAPSAEAMKAGRDFKVLELNGATAEATSIYDPKNGLGTAYRILRRQWALLFEIAARNVAAGAKPASIGELRELVGAHRRSLAAHVDA